MNRPSMIRFENWPSDDRTAWDRLFVDGGLFEVDRSWLRLVDSDSEKVPLLSRSLARVS